MLSQQRRWTSITAQTLMRAAALSSLIYSCQIEGIKLAQKLSLQRWIRYKKLDMEKKTLSLLPVCYQYRWGLFSVDGTFPKPNYPYPCPVPLTVGAVSLDGFNDAHKNPPNDFLQNKIYRPTVYLLDEKVCNSL